jgi:hypothetical protein
MSLMDMHFILCMRMVLCVADELLSTFMFIYNVVYTFNYMGIKI